MSGFVTPRWRASPRFLINKGKLGGHMNRFTSCLTLAAALMAIGGAACPATAVADDMAAFATGGYETGLRTMAMMHMIDTNKDGMVSKHEWIAFQERVFKAMDKDNKGFLVEKDFVSVEPNSIAFATAAYSRGLRTNEMFKKIDADGDGKLTRDEFVSYQLKIFEMMDVKKSHMIGVTDFILNK
jgi:Ca2+-binding EF-hand superfamily protein